jgi:hypothetical protein
MGRRRDRHDRARPLAFRRRPAPRRAAAEAAARADAAEPGRAYGLGLASFATPRGAAVGHTGNLLGTVSAVWSTPDGRRRVVAMTNSYPPSPEADTGFRALLETAFCGG